MTSTYQPHKVSKGDITDRQKAQAEKERRRRQREHIPESEKCAADFVYFVNKYVKIYDATDKKWIEFVLWTEQEEIAHDLTKQSQVIILKARQLGMTWLVLAYALWLMVFHPAATILLFSLRDTEAVYLLSTDRLKGMYKRLPGWLMMRRHIEENGTFEWVPRSVITDGGHLWELGNGSTARAFPTSAGDSYTATLAIVDEADLVPDLAALLLRVKPTIDGGGQLILLSKVNKALPMSEFKELYKGAKRGENSYKDYFLPWWVRPARDAAWYERQKRDAENGKEGIDSLYENYPATDVEALAPKQVDKRLPFKILTKVYCEEKPIDYAPGMPSLRGLRVYIAPRQGRKYVIGDDPAEGNPNSDDSAIQVVDAATGSQCAVLSNTDDVDVNVSNVETLSEWYNDAPALIERNNHGHAVIYGLRNTSKRKKVRLICGEDGKPGWQSNKRTKVVMYDDLAQTITSEDCMIFDPKTFNQLSSIEGSTLLAPDGMNDDEADSFGLAQIGRRLKTPIAIPPAVAGQRDTTRSLIVGQGGGRYQEVPIGRDMPAPVRSMPIIRPVKKGQRIVIIGWPGTGKTTLSKELGKQLKIPYRSTDEFMHLEWSAASEAVAKLFDSDRFLIEGVAVARALRKWKEAHPNTPAPVDRVILLTTRYRDLEAGAIRMGKGIDTVLAGLLDWLPPIERR